tara:strand:+ start:1389 stop:2549 length:1161 start_codon:yes stop_codon:yes gene_type:complete
MTLKKYSTSTFKQWFIELDAVVRHEILHYLINQKHIEDGDLFFDTLPFISLLNESMNASFVYLESLEKLDDDTQLGNLESAVGSLASQHATSRFLAEQDFMLQVIDKKSYDELSQEAKYTLTNKYPLAINTVKFLLREIDENPLPSYLWSKKLNESFHIEDLGNDNDLIAIATFHSKLIGSPKQASQIYLSKPALVTSIKKYEYIDFTLIGSDEDLELLARYKRRKICRLEKAHKKQVLAYCDNLLKHYTNHYITENTSKATILDEASLPLPPPAKMLSSRFDGYLALVIGLHCIKNRSRYKVLEGQEFEVESNFRSFVEAELLNKLQFMRAEYNDWLEKNGTGNELDDRKNYINNVLTKRIRSQIAKADHLIEEFAKTYFPENEK